MRSELKFSILILASVIIAGTVGFHPIEKQSLINSFYWTMVTITTMDYGDITPEAELEKTFSLFLMATGIGTILYIFNCSRKNKPFSLL